MSRIAGLYERSRHWSLTRRLAMAAIVILVAAAIVGATATGHDGGSGASSPAVTTAVDSTTAIATTRVPPTTAAAPTAPSTSGPASPGGIAQLVVAEPSHLDTYARDLFGGGWIDGDGDCQTTRAEVLIAESQLPVSYTSASDCTVATGQWFDPWSGTVLTSARALDVDHTVPLANAWRSGAWAWTPDQRLAYANDLADAGHLIAIPLGENRSKADDGPEEWKPPDHGAWCRYAQVWDGIKTRWNLTASPTEWSSLMAMAATC